MSSCSRWPLGSGGHVDASNQDRQMRTNRAPWERPNRAGERQHCVVNTNLIYYSFTVPSAQCESRLSLRILTRVCAGSITKQNCPVIPGWCADTRPQMCNCTSGNLEIPGSPLRVAPE